MKLRFHEKYGKSIVVIAGATSGLGLTYAAYFKKLGYMKIILIDEDHAKLNQTRLKLNPPN